MTKAQQAAVQNYLISLRDPSALRDDDAITTLQETIDQTDDALERLTLRQQLLDLQHPPLEKYEAAFVEHAKAWADDTGVTADAFKAEGVPAAVLRRAGFRRVTNGDTRRTPRAGQPSRTRRRVSADEVRAAIPSGTFTVKDVQQASGASAAIVRRVISEEVDAGNLTDEGPDPKHAGPGRAPTVYQRR
jgi:tryptophanase